MGNSVRITMNYELIIFHYYPEANKLREILLVHSRCVADYAIECARKHPELHLNLSLVESGAMLHDIGIIRCNAPGIECYGTEHYICHGTIGAAMLRNDHAIFSLSAEEIEPYARICERHTGTGLTAEQISTQGLPLPNRDLTPETLEEQLVCYADKFFSKTHPERRKTIEQALRSIEKFGGDGVERLKEWHKLFS